MGSGRYIEPASNRYSSSYTYAAWSSCQSILLIPSPQIVRFATSYFTAQSLPFWKRSCMALLPRWYLFTRLERQLAETSQTSAILFGSYVPQRSRKGQSPGRTSWARKGICQPISCGGSKPRNSNVPGPSMMKIRADTIALQKQTEGLLSEIVGTEVR